MSVKDRLKIFASAKNLTVQRLEQRWGVCNGYVGSIRKGVGLGKLEQLLNIFPDLNRDWLLYGEGEMLKKTESQTIVSDITTEYSASEAQADVAVPLLPDKKIVERNFDIRQYLKRNSGELQCIDPRDLVAGAQLCFRVLKPSMASALLPGDRVFVRFLPENAELISGDIYFIDTPARGGMIRKVEVMGDEIRLIALHPDYADIVLHTVSEVYSVAVIVGVFREFLSDSQFDINAIYKRKDEQIERVLNLQGELVAEIREQSKRNNALVDKIIKE